MLNRPRNTCTCIIINDALYQDLCMFVFFIIMTHHMHLRLCSNFRKQRRLITVLPDLPYYPGLAPKDFLLFLKLDEFLSGHLVVVTSPDKHHSFTQRTLMYFRNGFRDLNYYMKCQTAKKWDFIHYTLRIEKHYIFILCQIREMNFVFIYLEI